MVISLGDHLFAVFGLDTAGGCLLLRVEGALSEREGRHRIRLDDHIHVVGGLDRGALRLGYAKKNLLDGRPVTKVGIAFSSAERNITDWKAVPLNP